MIFSAPADGPSAILHPPGVDAGFPGNHRSGLPALLLPCATPRSRSHEPWQIRTTGNRHNAERVGLFRGDQWKRLPSFQR